MFYDLENKKPKNSGENWVAPNANIIGDVTLEKNTSIWFNATLRGDNVGQKEQHLAVTMEKKLLI